MWNRSGDEICYYGEDLLRLSISASRHFRWKYGAVFSLSPSPQAREHYVE
jgi:hypothetical protein